MAGGGFVQANGAGEEFEGKLTASVIFTCIMAASGGLIFGYDIGISGGVTTMEPFLRKFFPSVLRRMAESKPNEYCVYDSQVLTAFTSSLYVAALATSLLAGRVTKAIGRRALMLIGGATFFIGAAINAAAANIAMLIIGRLFLGCGVGFTNQATPLYLAETAPPRWRGAFNTGFQFFVSVGVVAANFTNYATARIRGGWGWRLSLGLAAAPAALFFAGALLVPDTPSTLVARGDHHKARLSLQRIRGKGANVEPELKYLIQSIEATRPMSSDEGPGPGPFRKMMKREYRHLLVMAVMLPLFQQMTGINIIAFYAPVLFQAVGFGGNAALMAAAILGAVNLGSVFVSSFIVDRYGRKVLFMQGGAQMIICLVAVACILGTQIGADGSGATLPQSYSTAVLVLMCAYSAAFGWSWGPLSWLIPSEIFPSEVRSAGQSINIAVSQAMTFVLAQTFLATLCQLKYGAFLFNAGWIVGMTAFVAAMLPETKGVPLESMGEVWARHWYWRRYCSPPRGKGEEDEDDC